MKRSNECIVIIDPQVDFIGKEGHYAKKHSGVSQILDAKENINQLLRFHLTEQRVIVTSDYQKNQFEEGLSICIPGTEGHKTDINTDETYTFISKKQHSCFSSPSFVHYLETNQIKKLLLCGFLAEYCVRQTAIDGLDNQYRVTLLKDCIGTGDDVQERKEQMLYTLKERGAGILDSWRQL